MFTGEMLTHNLDTLDKLLNNPETIVSNLNEKELEEARRDIPVS